MPALTNYARKGSWLAVGAGALVSTILSATVLVYALKAIPKFDLSDINRL